MLVNYEVMLTRAISTSIFSSPNVNVYAALRIKIIVILPITIDATKANFSERISRTYETLKRTPEKDKLASNVNITCVTRRKLATYTAYNFRHAARVCVCSTIRFISARTEFRKQYLGTTYNNNNNDTYAHCKVYYTIIMCGITLAIFFLREISDNGITCFKSL